MYGFVDGASSSAKNIGAPAPPSPRLFRLIAQIHSESKHAEDHYFLGSGDKVRLKAVSDSSK